MYAPIVNPIIPVIENDEPDKYGRDIRVGIKHNWSTSYLQTMTLEEAEALRDALTQFINEKKEH